MGHVHWLTGAAPAFDRAVVGWLQSHGVEVRPRSGLPRPPLVLPFLSRVGRIRAYCRRLRCGCAPLVLVLPYLAGDGLRLLLAGLPGARTPGVALGSDVLRRRASLAAERAFRSALRRYDAIWCVSAALAHELSWCGWSADWVAPVGVDLEALPALDPARREPGRIFSARREGPVYRRDWVREAAASIPNSTLVQPQIWTELRMMDEYQRAHVVVSVPASDGAPATVEEALCCGAHVVGSGGATVRQWLDIYGGTYGEPDSAAGVSELIRRGMQSTEGETELTRAARAASARKAFSRDQCLRPLLAWVSAVSAP